MVVISWQQLPALEMNLVRSKGSSAECVAFGLIVAISYPEPLRTLGTVQIIVLLPFAVAHRCGMLCSCFLVWSSSFQMSRASTFCDASVSELGYEGCVLLERSVDVELCCTYIIAWSGPGDSYLLADLHVRRDVREDDIVVACVCTGGVAEVAEECGQNG